jgi:hypothetical protein
LSEVWQLAQEAWRVLLVEEGFHQPDGWTKRLHLVPVNGEQRYTMVAMARASRSYGRAVDSLVETCSTRVAGGFYR